MRLRSALQASPGTVVELRPVEAQWFREYEYRQAFPGLTHEQYLDEPMEAIRWLTHIHAVVEKHKADEQEKANRAG